jgi:hypothetical protein
MQSNIFTDFLNRRKITDKVIEDFSVHVSGDRLVIPVRLPDGTFSFNKYRRSPLSEEGPKYTYDKGGKLALYGAYEARDAERVLWVEGEMDALVAWSHNIPAVSGTGGAMSIGEEWRTFFADRDVTVCFDNDPAGGEGMAKALMLAPHAKVMFLPDRAGVKDISDYVTSGGDLAELLKTAKNFTCLEEVVADRAERAATWHSTYFHDAYIKMKTKPAPKERAPRDPQIKDKILRAKAYPIDEMVSFNGAGNARCLWHAEKTASLHYYREENKTWCFGGCGRGYDAIDVYMKLHHVGFKEAVKALQ